MNDIKTWEDRITACGRTFGGHGGGEPCGLSNIFCSECRNKAKDAEIAELRAALAARATPAQPVGYVLFTGHGDKFSREKPKCEIDYWKPVYLESSRPSPSSVGAAIPEGWQLVPKEPTPKMIAAFAFKGDVEMAIGHAAIYEEACEDYTEMLHAAPSIAQDGKKPEVSDA